MKKKDAMGNLNQVKEADPDGDGPDMETETDHEAEMHMKTLMDAHKVSQNHDMMNRVRKVAGRHKKMLSAIEKMGGGDGKPKSTEDLAKIYKKKYGQGGGE